MIHRCRGLHLDLINKIKERLLNQFGARIGPYFPDGPIRHEAIWTGDVFNNLRLSVAKGDIVAIDIAISLIHTDPMWLPSGKLIKSNLARALKKCIDHLTRDDREKVIAITVHLLRSEHTPRELEDYAKLVKKFPSTEYRELVNSIMPRNKKAHAIKQYLT